MYVHCVYTGFIGACMRCVCAISLYIYLFYSRCYSYRSSFSSRAAWLRVSFIIHLCVGMRCIVISYIYNCKLSSPVVKTCNRTIEMLSYPSNSNNPNTLYTLMKRGRVLSYTHTHIYHRYVLSCMYGI